MLLSDYHSGCGHIYDLTIVITTRVATLLYVNFLLVVLVTLGFYFAYLHIPEVMKTGSANLNFLRNFSQLPLSNIILFTVLFTPDVVFFFFFF